MKINLNNNKFLLKKNFLFFKSIFTGFIKINKDLEIKIENKILILSSKSCCKKNILSYFKIVNNLLLGINNLWKLEIFLSGIGYKILMEKKIFTFFLGYTNPICIDIPFYIKADIFKNKIILHSVYKDKLGIFANKILKLKKYDPYKKKGLFFEHKFFIKKSSKKKQ